MAIKYVVTKRVFGYDPTKSEKYVPRQVKSGTVNFTQLCKQVGQICGAHRGMIQLVIAGLVDAMTNNLNEGMSVQLGEFGTFRPGIRSKSSDTADDATASSIYQRKIYFVPGATLKDVMNKASITLYTPPVTDYTGGGEEEGG